ncbi:conserved hypothetical protein [Gammaproteobacteria bacterium]
MTTPPIIESGMTFGPYQNGECFYIEKSTTYQTVQKNVPMAEFLLWRNGESPTVWIIEAKSSTPCPGRANFAEFIEEIREKLINAFSLAVALRLGRHKNTSEELPPLFKKMDLTTLKFCFVLVINGHHKDWLPPLQEKLSESLRSTVKTWALGPSAVFVINDDQARKRGLILTDG